MAQLQNILVGIDFSHCSKTALLQAAQLAEAEQAQLHVLHIVQDSVVTDLAKSLGTSVDEIRESSQNDAKGDLETLVRELGIASNVECYVRFGSPLGVVLQQVDETNADLLVLGAYGANGPRRGAGTFSTKCVRQAKTQVLLVANEQAEPFQSIVAAIDFSDMSSETLATAARVARRTGAKLRAVHVYHGPWHKLHYRAPTPQAAPAFRQQYIERLEGMFETFITPFSEELAEVDFQYELYEEPSYGHGIVSYAEKTQADLIVLGTANGSSLRYFFLGSTAERVLRELDCSVLTIPPEQRP